MGNSLLRNPTSIGDIFFSGSQTVKKGEQVTWILDETWAFKATEKCGVSTNASPFVTLEGGQTFIIYKRTQADIDAGNTKGIYIFDRDTVVALAYPQEVTQDIIIENENYNEIKNQIDNYNDIQNKINNNINVDTMSHVIASTGGDQVIKVNHPVTLTGSYTLKAGWTMSKEEWHENNTLVHTGASFAYTPTSVGGHLLYYTVTATDGHDTSKGQASLTVNAKANSNPIARITDATNFMAGGSTKATSWNSKDNDGTIVKHEWYIKKDGADFVLKATSNDYTFTSNVAGTYYIKLVVTDNDGGKGEDTKRIMVTAVPVEELVKIELKGAGKVDNATGTNLYELMRETAGKTASGTASMKASVYVKSRSTKNGAKIRMTVKKNNVVIGSLDQQLWADRDMTMMLTKNLGTTTVNASDTFTMTVQRVADSGSYDANSSQLNITIDPN